jgi:fatty-acyl-CoA synthase
MLHIATRADKRAAEAEMPLAERWRARSLYEQLVATAGRFPNRPAISFQLKAGPKDKTVAMSWAELRAEVTRLANLLRKLGVGPQNAVAYVLPNGLEAPIALLAGATAGVVSPINPLLSPEHIAGILRDTGAKVVVTLAPFPQTDLAQKVDAAVALAPGVQTVLQVDLARYLPTLQALAIPMVRPKVATTHRAQVIDYQSPAFRDTARDTGHARPRQLGALLRKPRVLRRRAAAPAPIDSFGAEHRRRRPRCLRHDLLEIDRQE